MDVSVTKHAIKRYRERLFDFKSSDKEIEALLKEIACRGKRVDFRPASLGRCYEVRYQGVAIVVMEDRDRTAIVTCLGSAYYRKWIKHTNMSKIPGRILYFEPYMLQIK